MKELNSRDVSLFRMLGFVVTGCYLIVMVIDSIMLPIPLWVAMSIIMFPVGMIISGVSAIGRNAYLKGEQSNTLLVKYMTVLWLIKLGGLAGFHSLFYVFPHPFSLVAWLGVMAWLFGIYQFSKTIYAIVDHLCCLDNNTSISGIKTDPVVPEPLRLNSYGAFEAGIRKLACLK